MDVWDYTLQLSRRLFNVCSKLSQDNDYKNALLRSAVSRAYYACYHRAWSYQSACHQTQRPRTGGDGHAMIIDLFIASRNTDEQYVGRTIRNLQRKRRHSDYEDTPLPERQAESVINSAEEIFEKLLFLSST